MNLPFARFIKAHHISRAALTAGILAAGIVFFVVGVGLRLLWGPVSLGPLKGTLARAIHDALPGVIVCVRNSVCTSALRSESPCLLA